MNITTANIREAIKASGVKSLDVDQVADHDDLAAAGLDSLDKFSLLMELEDRYGVSVPDEDLELLNSLSALANYVNERVSSVA